MRPSRTVVLTLASVLALFAVIVFVAFALVHRQSSSPSSPMRSTTYEASGPSASIGFVTPIPLPSEPAPRTAIQLYPILAASAFPASTATPVSEVSTFGGPVRVLRYAGDFVASSAFEGADGELYVTYFWDMGSTYYEADRLGILDGSAIREIFTGVFLDQVTIVGEHEGYPTFRVELGDTVHMSDNYGLWWTSASGVKLIEPSRAYSPPPHPCSWCAGQAATRGPGYCSPFAGGKLCDSSAGVTFVKNGTTSVIDKDAYLVGSGSHRFLIVERPFAESPVYIEGFAASD